MPSCKQQKNGLKQQRGQGQRIRTHKDRRQYWPTLLENIVENSNLLTRKSDIFVCISYHIPCDRFDWNDQGEICQSFQAIKTKPKACKATAVPWTFSCVFHTGRSVDDVI